MADPFAGREDAPAVEVHERLGNREPEPEATKTPRDGAPSLLEGSEQVLHASRRDADALVAHRQGEAAGTRVVGAHDDAPAVRGELERVVDEVPKDLLAGGRGRPRRDAPALPGAAPPAVMPHAHRRLGRAGASIGGAHDGVRVARLGVELQLAARHAREVEQIIDEPRLQLHAAADHRQVLAQVGGQRVVSGAAGQAQEDRP